MVRSLASVFPFFFGGGGVKSLGSVSLGSFFFLFFPSLFSFTHKASPSSLSSP